jgi:beta-glucanase (GH16 family)
MRIARIDQRFRAFRRTLLVAVLGSTGGAVGVLSAAIALGAASSSNHQSGTEPWALTWSDEFNGAEGTAPDSKKWIEETGGGGWGNHELEYYTSRRENSRVENGNLVIEAVQEKFTGTDGVTRDYTSARLKTAKLFEQKYGKFEARIRIPSGRGMWPAFWMLGNDISTVGWPGCGEIDVMENVGSEPAQILGSLHGPGFSGGHSLHAAKVLSSGKMAEDFHVFAVEWEPREIRFYFDGELYETRTPTDLPAGARWVFDHPFFLILNVALGGDWPGSPDASTKFPQRMLVDYVRVYEKN